MTALRTAGIVYVASLGVLVAYNVRWKYLWSALVGRQPETLPVTKVDGQEGSNSNPVPVILLHGMWHDASYYGRLQQLLSLNGYTSYAVSLLPGKRLLPGGSQKELLTDLEHTLKQEVCGRYILLGHSQGGLLTQSALQNSKEIRENAVAAVLLGTYPLGLTPPVGKLLKEPRNMYTDLGYAYICGFGKLVNVRYAKHMFLMPTTDEKEPAMGKYIEGLLKAPSDGLITMSHFPATPKPVQTPALVLGASDDIIYPPHLLKDEFDARFPNATHVVAEGQAHCFVDPGWEKTMAEPLLEWLDKHANLQEESFSTVIQVEDDDDDAVG
eukprot:CAMPEP_0194027824 /NCGR_PEP_ID=MMETSP0009_2-20130614/1872_1 /TAXON_ID=210454 /ORGANISM="Grammatophora oceanica, Strain CCMP 410" /LENGTH=325 /DNA_ID=CAMNT_0038666997 /DNA_START=24 /DNA_END=1002 /DNA_ORIENTATION=-